MAKPDSLCDVAHQPYHYATGWDPFSRVMGNVRTGKADCRVKSHMSIQKDVEEL